MRVTARQAAALQLLADVQRGHPAVAPARVTPPVNGQVSQYFLGLSKLPPEQAAQIAIMRWLDHRYPDVRELTFASAGGLHTSIRQASLMKSMGYRKGTPDIMIALPRGIFHGMFLELKSEAGRPSPEQKQVISNLQAQGYYAVIARGFAAATEQIAEYLSRGEAL